MNIRQFKKLSTLTLSLLALGILPLQTVHADDSGVSNGILQQIAVNTGDTSNKTQTVANKVDQVLEKVDGLPNYIKNMVEAFIPAMLEYTKNMTAKDDSDSTKALQTNFGTIGSLFATNFIDQDSYFLGPEGKPPALDSLMAGSYSQKEIPGAAGLFYSTMLDKQLTLAPGKKDDGTSLTPEQPMQDAKASFLRNASGFNITHKPPGSGFSGPEDAVGRYVNYYRTVMPVQSYNTYVLSNLYVQSANNRALHRAQMDLAAKVSGSDWIANISGIEIGKVIRQILMFESQSYVLMTQMLETQKQMLTVQAMTNSVLIAGFQLNERDFLKDATTMVAR